MSSAVLRISVRVWSPFGVFTAFFLRIAAILLSINSRYARDLISMLRDHRDHSFGARQQLGTRQPIGPIAIARERPKYHPPRHWNEINGAVVPYQGHILLCKILIELREPLASLF